VIVATGVARDFEKQDGVNQPPIPNQ